MIAEAGPQALTVWLPLPPGAGDRLEHELAARRADVVEALDTVETLHFARLALVPERSGFVPGLLLETIFDGELDAHRAALSRVFAPHHSLFAVESCGASDFVELVARHTLRAEAFYFAHRHASVATIRAESALDAAAQRWLDAARPGAEASPRDLAERLRGALGAQEPRAMPPAAAGAAFAGVRDRWVELALAALSSAWLELREAFESESALPAADPLLSSTARQSAFAHVVPLKPGDRRRELVRLYMWVFDALGARQPVLEAAAHSARWLLLPDGRLAFLAWHDGSAAAWLDTCLERWSRFISLLWTHTHGFPRTRWLAFGGARREAQFKRWARAYQVPTQIWYSAYPELSVGDIQRNRRLGEILAKALDDASARELCALL